MKAKIFFASVCLCAALLGGQTVQGQSHSTRSERNSQVARKAAESDYVAFDLSDVTGSPADYQGRLVRVAAEVISVDASRQLIRLYDAHARKMLVVSIAGLPRASRRSLFNDPVMRASVFGRAGLRDGRLIIEAHKVVALVAEPLAQHVVSE